MKIIILMTLSFCLAAQAAGDLDASFGTQGLVISHYPTQSVRNLASILDSQGRLLTVQGIHSGSVYNLFVHRYLANGTEDNSYIPLASQVDEFLIDGKFSLAVDDSDGVFLGFSNYTCSASNTDCQQDVFIKHYDNMGSQVGVLQIAYDFGSTYLRQNDVFAGMVFNAFRNVLAVASTVEYSSVFDTDFGVALIDVAADGSLALRPTFASSGLATCAFDQDMGHTGIGVDQAVGIFAETESPFHIVVGGNAFEGNGANNDGWNLAFCKLDVLGAEVSSWSTQNNINTLNDVEIMQDMKYVSNSGVDKIIIAAQLSATGNNDFYATRYLKTAGDSWIFDTAFGTNGWAAVGFSELFIGNTNDVAQSVVDAGNNNVIVSGLKQWQDNGFSYSKLAMARFDQFGQIISNWANNGAKEYDFSNNNKTQLNDVVYDRSQKELYAVGQYPNGAVTDAYIANISDKTNSIFLDGFE
ncbi:MAG: hypothetical protein ACWA5R_11265 [bacterium]